MPVHHSPDVFRPHANTVVDNLQLNIIANPPAGQTDGDRFPKPGMLEYILYKWLQQQLNDLHMHNLFVNINVQVECIGIFDPLDVKVGLHLLHFLL
ncbi:hypothetical protein D3C75_395590 [compost metagenome]